MGANLIRVGYSNYDKYTTGFKARQDLIYAAYKRVNFDPHLAPASTCVSSNLHYLLTDLAPALSVLGELLDLQQLLVDTKLTELRIKRSSAQAVRYSCWAISNTVFIFESAAACNKFIANLPLALDSELKVSKDRFSLYTLNNPVPIILDLLMVNSGTQLRTFKLNGFTAAQVDLEILNLRANIKQNLGADLTALDLILSSSF
jgi:hypothetical protein